MAVIATETNDEPRDEHSSALSRGGALTLSLASGEVRLEPGDVLVQTTFADGWMLAEEAGLQVALATTLTQELIDEGVARDCVRFVQQLRKDANLDIKDLEYKNMDDSTTETTTTQASTTFEAVWKSTSELRGPS